ncbi:MAG: MFS transporter [Dermatophilaceae bacterium]
MTLREALATQPMRPFQIRVIVICIVLAFVDGFEVLVGAFTATALSKDFGLDAVQIGYFLSASTFGMAVGAVFISPLADRIGRRRHILLCLTLIVVGMAASAIAPNYGFLLVARAFAGLWIGALIPSLNILVSEYSSDAKRGTAMGIYGIGLPAGSGTGGFITTFLIAAYSWRAAFWFGTILTLALLIGSLFWLPESIHYLVEKHPPKALDEYNKIAGQLGYPAEDELPPAHNLGQRNVVVSAIFKGIMLKRTLLLWFGYGLLTAAFYFGNQWTPRLVTQSLSDKVAKSKLAEMGWSSYVDTPKSAIEALAKSEPTKGWDVNVQYVQQMSDSAAQAFGNNAGVLVSFGGVVAALLFAWLATKMHPRMVTVLVMFWGVIAYFLYANLFQIPALALILAIGVGMAGNGGIVAFYAISPAIYPTAARGTGVGWMVGFGRTWGIVAPIVSGYLLAAGLTAKSLYMLFGVLFAIAGFCVLALHRTYHGESDAMMEIIPAAEGADA